MNAIGAAREVTYDSVPYDGGYSEEVHYIGNQVMGSWSTFPRPPKKHGWNNSAGR